MSLERLGGDGLSCSPALQALGVMVGAKMNISPCVVCSLHESGKLRTTLGALRLADGGKLLSISGMSCSGSPNSKQDMEGSGEGSAEAY